MTFLLVYSESIRFFVSPISIQLPQCLVWKSVSLCFLCRGKQHLKPDRNMWAISDGVASCCSVIVSLYSILSWHLSLFISSARSHHTRRRWATGRVQYSTLEDNLLGSHQEREREREIERERNKSHCQVLSTSSSSSFFSNEMCVWSGSAKDKCGQESSGFFSLETWAQRKESRRQDPGARSQETGAVRRGGGGEVGLAGFAETHQW